MKRDDVVLPELEKPPPPSWKSDPVREGMNHYYDRDADALRRLLQKLVSERKEKE